MKTANPLLCAAILAVPLSLCLFSFTHSQEKQRAEDYRLVQSQIADEVPIHGPVDKATVYVLLCPEHRVYVFRAFDSHEMEETVKHFPRGSILHYDGNAMAATPKQAEIDKLMAFCKSAGITLELTPTS